MARTVEYTVTFEVENETTDEEIADILFAAEVQVVDAEVPDPDDPTAMNTYTIHTKLLSSISKVDGKVWSTYVNDEEDNG